MSYELLVQKAWTDWSAVTLSESSIKHPVAKANEQILFEIVTIGLILNNGHLQMGSDLRQS